ncbi:MAG: calcium-binding protein [Nitrosomonas sp.]|jgi:hypothetical protein
MLKKHSPLFLVIFCSFFLVSGTAFSAESDKGSASSKPQEHKHSGNHQHSHAKSDGSSSHHEQCSQKMSMVDLNKDNKISKEEFIKHHEDMFAAMDTNKDGFLDESEMHHMMDQMHGKHGKSNHGHHGESDHKHPDHGKEKSK